MPISDHLISFFPRLLMDVELDTGTLGSENSTAHKEVAVEGARPDMVFLTRLLPSIQNQVAFTPIHAFCEEDNKVEIMFWGSGAVGDLQVTIVGI